MRNDATEAALGLLGLHSISASASTIPLKRKQSSSSSAFPSGEESTATGSDSINCICGFTYDDGFSIGCDSCSRWCHAACFDIVETEVPDEWECWVCRPRPVDREHAIKVQKARQKAAALAREGQVDKQKRRVSPGVERRPRRPNAMAVEVGQHKRKRRSSINVQQSAEDEPVDIDEPWTLGYVHIDKDIIPNDDTRDKLRRVATHWRGVTALHSNPPTPVSPYSTPALMSPDSISTSSQISLQPLPKSSISHSPLGMNLNPSVRPPSCSVHATHPIQSSKLITPFTSTIISSTAYLSDPLNVYAHLGMPKPFVHLIGPPLDVALDARITGNEGRFVRSGCRPNAVLRPVLCPRGKRSRATQQMNNGNSSDNDETLTFGIFALRDLKANEEVVLGWEWDDGNVIHHLPALIDSPHIFPPHQIQTFRHQMTSLLHALSSTFTTCACGSHARDCALARMAEFIESQTPPTPSPSPPSGFMSRQEGLENPSVQKKGRESDKRAGTSVDLGPLIGVERGFRTRERVPMSGGIGGVEMISTSHEPSAFGLADSTALRDESSSVVRPSESRMGSEATDGQRRLSVRKVVSVPELSTTSKTVQSSSAKSRIRKGKGRTTHEERESSSSAVVSTRECSDNSGSALNEEYPQWTQHRVTTTSAWSSSCRSPSPIINVDMEDNSEAKMPPKLRKAWIHRSFEALRETYVQGDQRPVIDTANQSGSTNDRDDGMEDKKMDVDQHVFDPKEMPPPPLPSPLSPTVSIPVSDKLIPNDTPISPSIPFANLSLLSPVVSGSSAYFSENCSATAISPVSHITSASAEVSRSHSQELHEQSTALGDVQSPMCLVPSSSKAPSSDECNMIQGSLEEPKVPPLIRASPSVEMVVDRSTVSGRGQLAPPVDDLVSASEMPTQGESPELIANRSPEVVTTSSSNTLAPEPPLELHAIPASSSPPPPAPPKVKLSLKDFAQRKKKQREEELVKALAPPPTVIASVEPPDGQRPENQCSQSTIANSDAIPSDGVIVPNTKNHGDLIDKDEKMLIATGRPTYSDCLPAHESLKAKIELIEDVLPRGPHVADEGATAGCPPLPEPPPPLHIQRVDRARSPSPNPEAGCRLSPVSKPGRLPPRQLSQEDGEILSPPPQKAPRYTPRSHSPPTQPRSFQSGESLSSTTTLVPIRRPLHPAPHRVQLQNTVPVSRPLPSGPRALRTPNHITHSSVPSRAAVELPVPRGPSADRERFDWDRDRMWMGPARRRSRGNKR
ncbi:hypothetical protein AcV7_003314 [Taiwanofungus camphoratus]|nr:hypothetical protein AcV7_003314 [Antrodia cinnamomea]